MPRKEMPHNARTSAVAFRGFGIGQGEETRGFAHPEFSETVFAHLTSYRNLGLRHMARAARLPFSGWALWEEDTR